MKMHGGGGAKEIMQAKIEQQHALLVALKQRLENVRNPVTESSVREKRSADNELNSKAKLEKAIRRVQYRAEMFKKYQENTSGATTKILQEKIDGLQAEIDWLQNKLDGLNRSKRSVGSKRDPKAKLDKAIARVQYRIEMFKKYQKTTSGSTTKIIQDKIDGWQSEIDWLQNKRDALNRSKRSVGSKLSPKAKLEKAITRVQYRIEMFKKYQKTTSGATTQIIQEKIDGWQSEVSWLQNKLDALNRSKRSLASPLAEHVAHFEAQVAQLEHDLKNTVVSSQAYKDVTEKLQWAQKNLQELKTWL